MLDAYRWIPINLEEQHVNIVAVFDDEVGAWKYQELWGHVFGLGSAVLNFNRVPKFLVKVMRRCLMLVTSMYFDDLPRHSMPRLGYRTVNLS